MEKGFESSQRLAASITWAASKQTYYTIRFLVDRDRVTAFAVTGYASHVNPAHELQVKEIIQQETGGNLAETLENLAVILRKRRQMKLKVKAKPNTLKARATRNPGTSEPVRSFSTPTTKGPAAPPRIAASMTVALENARLFAETVLPKFKP